MPNLEKRADSKKIMTAGRFKSLVGRLALAALILGSVVSEVWSLPRGKTVRVRDTTFENGLTVLAMEDRSDPLIVLRVSYHVGSRDEPAGKSGLAKVAEEVMKSGSAGYRREEYGRMIHSRGGSFTSRSWQDNTVFTARFPKELLRSLALNEADRMESPLLTLEVLELAKWKVLQARRNYLENYTYAPLVVELFKEVFPDHPYGRLEFGLAEDIRSLTLDDLEEWMETYYQPSNATLTFVGDFKTKNLFAEIAEIFADIPSYPPPARNLAELTPQDREHRSTVAGNLRIPVFIVGYRTPELTHADRFALDLLASILVGGRSSRVYQRLVSESGLCMEAGGNLAELEAQSILYFFAFANSGQNLADAETALFEELETAKSGGISEAELIVAKNQLQVEFHFRNSSARSRAESVGWAHHLSGDAHRWFENIELLRQVTLNDVKRVARTYLDANRRTMIYLTPSAKPADEPGE